MLTNRNTLIEQSNKNFSVQINKSSNTFPAESQSFYQIFLNKRKKAKSTIIQEKINSFINDEFIFWALQKRE